MSDLVALLRGAPIFAELDGAVLARLAARCVPRTVGEGFTLFRAGDRCQGTYFVLEGRVRIYRTSPDGREQTLAVQGAGSSVAEMPMFDGGPYPASGVTTAPSRLIYLPRAEFELAFRTDPEVASAVVRALGRRMRHLVQLVETVAFRDVAARLAMLLADYAERLGTPAGDSVALQLERTQDELATEIGTARESVSRAHKQLQAKGLLRERRGTALLLAPVAELREFARGDGR
ncbi:MAG: Crp/Fnr family transcriptional regulator [Gemmatimonadales bacterium]|nr:Crp/Fnr family transcriptional regulator [Gemmatimonadales bacterium]